jgi:hypothetical protein
VCDTCFTEDVAPLNERFRSRRLRIDRLNGRGDFDLLRDARDRQLQRDGVDDVRDDDNLSGCRRESVEGCGHDVLPDRNGGQHRFALRVRFVALGPR